eukprot:CAMPEP_0168555916 /NCGR_PEP_ID=MMETSP0413-20121227/8599_1 /TAXON_ID=136452 /ORGANISM="Filamoeba nolandi, Strain NC-AS-23-1" /LENGTH=114 /DNA_ID=CAMNT_0008586817 /DNA_START=12 /DNA_END=356 /DNA_ORIENTATION=+
MASNTTLNLSGEWEYTTPQKTLIVFLENDGFFRLKYEERESDGVAINEEKGKYEGSNANQFLLAAVERQWSWKDSRDGDSGTDATDLTYPASLKNDGSLEVVYLETPYLLKKKA